MTQARKGNLKAVKILLDNGADIHAMNLDGPTSLAFGLVHKRISIVSLLLERGANLDSMTTSGNSVLELAAAGGEEDMIQLLRSCREERSTSSK